MSVNLILTNTYFVGSPSQATVKTRGKGSVLRKVSVLLNGEEESILGVIHFRRFVPQEANFQAAILA